MIFKGKVSKFKLKVGLIITITVPATSVTMTQWKKVPTLRINLVFAVGTEETSRAKSQI